MPGNLQKISKNLISFKYKPKLLRRFIVNDPKSRVIHASEFRDRIVHHAIINVIGPIFEKTFIYNSYASRIGKGHHKAIQAFDKYKQKVSSNGRLVKLGGNNKNLVQGYILKADIEKYFDTVDHEVLLGIIRKKIQDENILWLIKKILHNFEGKINRKGMPLGNYTSQFFANVYLNRLDYFVKHRLKVSYYIRYVDDFIILHQRKEALEDYKHKISLYLKCLKIKLHQDKSRIIPLRNGVSLLGYRIYYHYKLLRKRNISSFKRKFAGKIILCKESEISKERIIDGFQGWFGYAQWANTYKLRQEILDRLISSLNNSYQ